MTSEQEKAARLFVTNLRALAVAMDALQQQARTMSDAMDIVMEQVANEEVSTPTPAPDPLPPLDIPVRHDGGWLFRNAWLRDVPGHERIVDALREERAARERALAALAKMTAIAKGRCEDADLGCAGTLSAERRAEDGLKQCAECDRLDAIATAAL